MQFEELQSAVSRRSDSPLFAQLAASYLEQGNIKNAIELCTAGIEQHPAYVTGYYILARCLAAQSQFAEAVQAIVKARAIFPDSSLLVGLQQEWEQKIPKPASLPDADEDEMPAQTTGDGEIVSKTLAEIYVQQGLIEQAVSAYQKLKQRKPEEAKEFDKRIQELQKKSGKKQ